MLEIFKNLSYITQFLIFFSAFLTHCITPLFFDLRAGKWGQTIDLNFFIQNLLDFKNKYWFLMWFLKKKNAKCVKKILRQQVFFVCTAYFVRKWKEATSSAFPSSACTFFALGSSPIFLPAGQFSYN